MGRDNNTFAKRQREILKRQKAEDKKARRKQRKERADSSQPEEQQEQAVDEPQLQPEGEPPILP